MENLNKFSNYQEIEDSLIEQAFEEERMQQEKEMGFILPWSQLPLTLMS